MQELRRVNTLLNRSYDNTAIASIAGSLVALASGWSIDTTGVAGTISAKWSGASVLQALQDLAKWTGYHFRLDSNKALKFGDLGDTAPLRLIQTGSAVQPALENNTDVAFIDRLTWLNDTENVVNWIVPVGKDETVSLQDAQIGNSRTGCSEALLDQWSPLNTGIYTKFGQSFQISTASNIYAARMYLGLVKNPGGTLTLRMETDNAGAPSGTLAHANAVATLRCDQIQDYYTEGPSWETFFFANSFALSASTTYWIVVSCDYTLSATDYVWFAVGTGAYASGKQSFYNGSWNDFGGTTDMIFDVWGSDTTVTYRTIGYELDGDDVPNYYMLDSTSITAYGQCEGVCQFSGIEPLSESEADKIAAAKLLYEAANAYLDANAVKRTVYGVTAKHVYQTIKPGQLIRLVYKGYVYDTSGTKIDYVDTDTTFYVIKATENGVQVQLEISDIATAPDTVSSKIAQSLTNSHIAASDVSATIIATGLTRSTINVSNPPTDAELDAAYGTPATVGSDFFRVVDDNDANTSVYLVHSNGTSWWYAALTKAT
jgi:hypothetical protein